TGMIIAPCSVRTLGALVNSIDDNLLVRAADVCLKESRRVVLLVRETPLHIGHLRLMVRAAEMGAVLLPPVPAFYHNPITIDDLVLHTVGKALDQFGIDVQAFRRWQDRMPDALMRGNADDSSD
ncbi:MAG: UbiX family flavin prenyltransferase, partial [Candidatus Binatia bacterium]